MVLARLTEQFVLAGQNDVYLSVCLSVWMLTKVEQVVTAAHKDF